jgi:hypothetical protein
MYPPIFTLLLLLFNSGIFCNKLTYVSLLIAWYLFDAFFLLYISNFV